MIRRDFLRLCSLAGLSLARGAGQIQPSLHVSQEPGWETRLQKYIDPLPIPSVLESSEHHDGVPYYRVRMIEFRKRLHSQLPPATLWGYEGQYPGPTLEARRGQRIFVKWENHLPKKPLFAIDPHIHGAAPPSPAVRAVTHLHGARNRPEDDGLAEKWFPSGESATYVYPNEQPGAMLWYHDHAMGITRLNVYAGLAGVYLLRDEQEQELDLPSGKFEIPLLLQDRSVDAAGQLVYAPSHDDGIKLPPGVWGPEFFGDLPVINGAIFPFLNVEPRPYRLRMLNGSNARFFHLFFNLAKSPYGIPSLVKFAQIGTDSGLLSSPVSLDSLSLAPAERADLIVDFSGLEGKTITLSNDALAPYPGWEKDSMLDGAPLNELMQIRVVLPLSVPAKPFDKILKAWKVPFAPLDPKEVVKTRDLAVYEYRDRSGHTLSVKIDGKGYDDPVTEIVKYGSVEKWRFINTTSDAHPMHLHMVQFQVVERQGFDTAAFAKGTLRLVGPRRTLDTEFGWKDTARVNPGEVLTILVRFDNCVGRSAYHCHMLEHEDNETMRPYRVDA